MSQILGIKFTDYGQTYMFSSGAFVVTEGQDVIVKTEQGMGLGKVVVVKGEEAGSTEDLSAIYRLANEEDMAQRGENLKLARDAYRHCRKCIQSHELDMKLVDVEVFFDRSKMIFYFTAPGRIDFRELIKDLVREYRTRIELRQIGVRHETQMLGAVGNCGQLCCCRRFLRKFVPVTIKMAKEQNLFLNPTKISGICGRLLCCLSFEQEGYEEFHRACPKVGKRYQTALGQVKVLRTNFFRKTLSLLLEDNSDREIPLDEWAEIVNKPPGEDAPRRDSGRSDSPRRNSGRRPGPSKSGPPKSGSPKPGASKPGSPKEGDQKPAGEKPRTLKDRKQAKSTESESKPPRRKSRRRRRRPKPKQ